MHDNGADQERPFLPVGVDGVTDGALRDAAILIVEDEFVIAVDLEFLVEAAGAVVVGPAATVAEALRLVHGAKISCAILDVRVRDETVFPVAIALRAKGIPFLFQTGNADSRSLARDWPGYEVLVKPVGYALLLASLARMLAPGGARADGQTAIDARSE